LPPANVIHPLIESYSAFIARGRNPLDVAGDTGQKLYGILLAPVPEAAVAGNRFIIVQDGDLHSFPLESLPAHADPRKFWIEQVTVAIAPSLSYLASQTHSRSGHSARELLVIGEPSSSSPQYPHLEFAAQEIESIASGMNASRSAVLRGDDATPDSYTRSQPGRFGFIHLAAHATVNPRSPLDSAVILSGPAEKNRLLARDVTAIPLSAELVTISACRSAGGKSYAGEGLVGFAWAFLSAGARNVIAGLWDVGDRSTAQLMSALYREIAAGRDAPEALRNAKLTLIRAGGAYAKPFYWAPFQLYIGSPR
jgi:CHAT domain-containing protein